MLQSVSDIDIERLSEPSRQTLYDFAPLHEGFFTFAELCRQLEIEPEAGRQRMELLAAEIIVQSGGADLPALTKEEYAILRDSIAEHGQLVDILVDGAGKIIDGHHRYRACRELGLEPRVRVAVEVGLTADERRRLALVVNVARRQVQASARRGIVAAELIADPIRSDRAIASLAGVSDKLVGRVRKDLLAAQQLRHVAVRVGKDGKERRAPTPKQRPLVECPSCGHRFDPIEGT